MKLLIANRGEVAIRVARAAADLAVPTVAVFAEDDAQSLHVRAADEAVALSGRGPAAYLDAQQLLSVAIDHGCDAIHPGYGFLSEDPAFAQACANQGLAFVGPAADTLARLGDKATARALAAELGLPVIEGTGLLESADEAAQFLASLDGAPMILKAAAGGGGRGLRVVTRAEEISSAFEQCRTEALAAFGRGEVFAERHLRGVRHVEVQVVGDGAQVVHLWERDCSLQRRRQKVVELAPAPGLDDELRDRLVAAAVTLAGSVGYRSLGTVELLVDPASGGFWFLECNPRLQVEHTVTEAVTGVDLVQAQLRIAAGETLEDLGLTQDRIGPPAGMAAQFRITTEVLRPDGTVHPAGGTITTFELPSGPGVRVDACGYAGYTTNPNFDALLAKVVVHAPTGGLPALVRKADRALSELRIEGVGTNAVVLRTLLAQPEVEDWSVDTRFVEDHLDRLLGAAPAVERFFGSADANADDAPAPTHTVRQPLGTDPVPAPLQALVLSVGVEVGDEVHAGQEVAVLEAMKMHHAVVAAGSGIVRAVAVTVGEVVGDGEPVLFVEPSDGRAAGTATEEQVDLATIRADLAEWQARTATTLDAARPEAVAKRRARGMRTARENVDDLCEPGSFLEYGQLIVAGQTRHRSMEDLIAKTPADGLIAGIGAVNAERFGPEASRAAVLAYDYTVLAGTQGAFNHKKTDRVLELAHQWRLPVVFFTEGGGGRPGDTDWGDVSVAGLDIATFATFAKTSGGAPRIAVNAGFCFAGNAVLFGCADVTIATRDSCIGLAGPVMIEGGGLGTYRPQEIGPIDVQVANGVVDLVADDEAHAVALAKQVLAYFQGPVDDWSCTDQRALRHVVPPDRQRVYDMRTTIELIADEGSVLELRRGYGVGMITSLVRIEGKPFGIFANDPRHLGGAIDAEAAEKAARFLQLCDAFDLPLLSLCDTPGFMVGPRSEEEAAVRRASSMAVVGANVTVPLFMVVTRKGYGLGAMAMGGGSFWETGFTASWPTGEFGGMGLEGAVRITFKAELEAAPDDATRKEIFDRRVAEAYERGKALSMARYLEIDAVIDPADTRRWITGGLDAARSQRRRPPEKNPFVDAW